MKKIFALAATALLFVMISATVYAADGESAPKPTSQLEGLDRIESIVYGAPSTGGLLLRLSKIERDLWGMELPGSLTERQEALQIFVEQGSASQPSLLFKMGIAELVSLRHTNAVLSLANRVSSLEEILEGEIKSGPISPRIESMITKVLPGGVKATPVTLPAGTVFKASFTDTVTVRNVKVGDIVRLKTEDDCVVDGVMAIPQGSCVAVEVTKVKMPRSFGRSSEISFEYKWIETLGGKNVPILIGPEAQKAAEIDSGAIGAGGAALAGAIALGPLGLAGGFLVRGNDKQIPAGTLVYVQTDADAVVDGYASQTLMGDMSSTSSSSSAPAQQQGDQTQLWGTDGSAGQSDGGGQDTVVY